jgi:asparagine synthase (glutamine-hydrolysing)
MSAIVAIFHRDGQPVRPEEIQQILAAAPHRGVDGEALHIDRQVALAHQHFWITPEEQGEIQPTKSETGCQLITADARLDNRDELISALRARKSDTDTALILRAYEAWGIQCVSHLLGDFAFVIWDARNQQLFAARDPLGVRDLCYFIDGDICVIASEVNQVLAHHAVPRRINDRRVVQYLNRTWVGDEETFFEEVFYCPPAHCLLVTEDLIRKWRYWDIDPSREIVYKEEREYAEQFLTLFTEAVRCRLRTDKPVGISLSGGLDSTSVAAVAARLLPERLHTFSYVFDRLKALDERVYIEPVVAQYDMAAHYLNGDDCWPLSNLERWPIHQDFIYHDPYAWLPLSVMKAASAHGCRVLLTGLFGDQLFLGGRFWATDMIEQKRLATLARTVKVNWRHGVIKRDVCQLGVLPFVHPSLKRLYRRFRPSISHPRNTGLHPRLSAGPAQNEAPAEPAWGRSGRHSQIARYRTMVEPRMPQGASTARQELNAYHLERLDPFWDRRLVEFTMALPADILGLPGNPKRLLREAMRGLLPEKVRTRTGKTSFKPLFDEGLREHERDTVRALTSGSTEIVRRQYTTASWLTEEGTAVIAGTRSGATVWLFLCLELWLQRYWT